MRPVTVIGNWKMHKTARESVDFIEQLAPKISAKSVRIGLAVPFTSIASAAFAAKQTSLLIGAQNVHESREGAFTGEISSLMLKEAGTDFVLIGHSERRHVFKEQEISIQKKLERALQDGLIAVLCTGETLEEQQKGQRDEILTRQIESALQNIPKEALDRFFLAYEPVWAIGSSKPATAKLAQEAHHFCRQCLVERFGSAFGEGISILYGGSVTSDNAKRFVQQPDIDGVLVGGASLDVEAFSEIISNCEGDQ